jgi:hypothetical protein
MVVVKMDRRRPISIWHQNANAAGPTETFLANNARQLPFGSSFRFFCNIPKSYPARAGLCLTFPIGTHMARHFAAVSLGFFTISLFGPLMAPSATFAQNLLVNGGFETTTGTQLGNNLNADVSPWNTGRLYPGSGAQTGVFTQGHDLIEVDGATGPNIVNNLYPQSDASAPGIGIAQHYIDPTELDVWSGGPHYFGVWQYFTPSCDGIVTASADFASVHSFSRGELSVTPVMGPEALTAGVPVGTFLNTQGTSNLQNNHNAHKAVLNLQGGNGGQTWEALSGQYPVQANQRYAFVAMPSQHAFLDNAAAVLDCNPPTMPIAASDISMTKSCTPASSVEHNGQVGQMWDCSVDVTVPNAPFTGELSVTDVYTPISTTTSEIVSSSSASGHFDCTSGATCTIAGTDFNTSGSETLDYSVFITATELQDTYPMQNCVEGSYDNGAGTPAPVAGNCVPAQWIPRSSITKTCDPIASVTSGPMTLNCQIDVTGTDLATGSFVLAADAFAALPPVTATIAGTMMNVTSAEPWSCVDQNINNPGSIGICELSATDMLTAGGASTINVSFAFTTDQTTDQTSGQVVNCPMTDILPASFIGAAGQRSSAPTMRAPQSNSIAGLPDNCAIVDLPVSTTPPEFTLKKGCRLAGVQDENAFYACSIYVTQTDGTPITDPLTFDELFSTTSGNSASQYILNLQGTPAMPNGWDCQQPPYANSASCTIAAADFNANPSHRIDAYLSIPTAALGKEDFQNCAQVRIGDQVVGSADCVEIEEPPVETTFDVEKSCKEAGPRQTLSASIWFQPYQCTLTVNTNGAPFTGPLWLSEDLTFGPNAGAGSILNITSADPWVCSPPPYAPAGQGTVPECSIDGAQFPASGSSSLTVDLMTNATMDMFGAQNCVSIGLGKEIGQSDPLAEDCFEIAPPPAPDPSLDITKTCTPALRDADGIWTAECEIDIHFENFDTTTNHQFYIYDELSGDGPQTPLTSLMPFNAMGMGAWGPQNGTPAGFNNATGMLLNYLQADGSGSITQPYTATFSGPAGQLINGNPVTNCAWVTIPSLPLRAPAGPVGDEKACVPITFPITAVVDTGVILDPALPDTPVGPIIGTGSVGSTRPDIVFPRPNTPTPPVSRPILTIVKEQTGSCEAHRTSQTYDCGFRLRVTNTGNAAYLGPLVVTDTGGAPGISAAQVVSGNGWSCGTAVNNALSCSNPAVSLAPGASSYVDLRMKVKALRKGGTFQNCAVVGVSQNRTDRVALVQKIMNDRGLNAGPVDGKPGQKTYAAMSKLRSNLGLPDSRDFDDALFEALGLPLQKAGAASCVSATLPVMPAPPLQCNAATTVKQGESCACRYDNMDRRNATSCQCVKGFTLVKGKGCVEVAIEAPAPAPAPKPALQCDLRSTYQRGDVCACIDHKNAENISATQCGCTNGLPMINGQCIPLVIKPTDSVDDVDGTEKCRIKLNGICIK